MVKQTDNFNRIKGNYKVISVFLLFLSLTIVLFLFILPKASAAESIQCCERTTSGAWCQESPPATCDPDYLHPSTSCESTVFCRTGTCVNSNAGDCRPNVPQKVCEQNSGTWFEGSPNEIQQCQLGCCMIGDQTSYVTQDRCKQLSSDFGVQTNYRTDIKSEEACIALANSNVKGACVIDNSISVTCKLITQGECNELEASVSGDTTVDFVEGHLCSDESLGTNCGRTKETTCLENQDKVYFVDSCGNPANIYDASRADDPSYWTTIEDINQACNPDSSNANSASCGSCNAVLGSTCKAYQRGNSQTPTKPTHGDYVCADLSCNYNGEKYQNGETWCANSSRSNQGAPGSEDYRMICYNGQVSMESCSIGAAAGRAKTCLEEEVVPGFSAAACIINRWQDCVSQDNKKDCENIDQRDCKWVVGQTITAIYQDSEGKPFVVNKDGKLVQESESDNYDVVIVGGFPRQEINKTGAACLPKYPPGFDFWNPEGEAQAICATVSTNCVVKFEKGLFGSYECKENCECLGLENGDKFDEKSIDSAWAKRLGNMCLAMGDCGTGVNYIGVKGYDNKEVVEISPLNKTVSA